MSSRLVLSGIRIGDDERTTHGKLKTIGSVFYIKHVSFVVCECECGSVTVRRLGDIRSGKVVSCGCVRRQLASKVKRPKHGMHKTPEFRAWINMQSRCLNINHTSFKDYGGRGITIASEWLGDNGFVEFFKHVGKRPTAKHSIDRIDTDGNYEPGNIRWATAEVQCNNKRNSRKISFSGSTLTVAQWARLLNVSVSTLQWRLRSKWPLERALTFNSGVEVTE